MNAPTPVLSHSLLTSEQLGRACLCMTCLGPLFQMTCTEHLIIHCPPHPSWDRYRITEQVTGYGVVHKSVSPLVGLLRDLLV